MLTKGQIIKALRQSLDISQEELVGASQDSDTVDDIVSVANLSKIENGHQEPEWNTFKTLLEKMGQDPRRFIYTMSKNEVAAIELEYDIIDLLEQRNYKKVEKQLDKFENLHGLSKKAQSFIDYIRIILDEQDGVAAEDLIASLINLHGEDKLNKLLKTNIRNIFLTQHQIRILNFLANCYTQNNSDKAIAIWELLLNYIELVVADKPGFTTSYTAICYTLSRHLGLQGELEESLKVSIRGIDWCIRYGRHQFYKALIFNKAYALIELDRDLEEAHELFRLSYLLFKQSGDTENMEIVKEHAEKHNLKL